MVNREFSFKTNKTATVFLFAGNILFLLLYATLCFNNRLTPDDFHFLSTVREFGIIDGTIYEYNSWSTRWISVLLNHSVLQVFQHTEYALFIFGLFNLIIFIFVILLLIRNLNRLWDKDRKYDPWFILSLSVFIVNAIFVSTIRINETWFWLCSSCTYLWSVMMFVLGVAWLINGRKNILFSIAGCLAFVYVGGSCDPFAVITMLSLAGIIVLIGFNILRIPVPKRLLIMRCVLALFFCLTSFIVLYSGPGIRARENYFQDISMISAVLLNFKMTGIILLKRLPSVLPLAALFCLPAFYWGTMLMKSTADKNWKIKTLLLTIGYFLIIFLYQLPVTYKTQDVGAYRALFPVSIFTIVYFGWLFFLIGKNVRTGKRLVKMIVLFSFAASCLVNGYCYFRQAGTVHYYSSAYDQRIRFVKQNPPQNPPLMLEPLPPSGMIYSAEITSDTSNFLNQYFKEGLNLKFSVRLK
jgi:hypothetical protein